MSAIQIGTNFNIPQLMQQYFNVAGSNEPDSDYSGASFLPTPVEVNKSIYGVPIYEQITLTQQGTGANVLQYSFPGWPLMEINRSIEIKKTKVTDNPGTVKEYIGENDVEITIRGFLINHDQRAVPLDLIQQLNAVVDLKQALKVTSELLNTLNIHYLVIENLRFPEVEASIMVQPFIIDAISDYPYQLVINDAVNSKTLTAQQKATQLLLSQ